MDPLVGARDAGTVPMNRSGRKPLFTRSHFAPLTNDIRIAAWFSFTSRDGASAASGDPIRRVRGRGRVLREGRRRRSEPHGSQPDLRGPSSRSERRRASRSVVYPNSGETALQDSTAGASGTDFVSCVGESRQAWAALIGGCCRTSPPTVQAIARALREADADEYDDLPAVAVL
ncbi:hypothetical protein C2845_PM08G27030 [Panicum miliaceum]|uniref:Hcy-binding domain-containing protein n=1 Tax=Panicum miliaceum TaxID=4540 RepID=A0A3L6R787_PANMI|nr:hypothetical protein C2845_PM08G27030 [Panicum miliaceum]